MLIYREAAPGEFDFKMDLFSTPIAKQTYHGAGALSDCFLLNICSEKQILPRIFYHLRTAKNF